MLSFVDSSGLGTLVGLKVSAASAAYCSLEFINFSPLVKEHHQLSQLLDQAEAGAWFVPESPI